MSLLHEDITKVCIKAFYNVYNDLGFGHLEQPYEKAMMIELKKLGLSAVRQHPIKVYYDGQIVGDYFADIVVEGKVILELKAVEKLTKIHKAQLMNYLKSTKMEVGLLMNFGEEHEIVRRIFENHLK